MDGKNYDEEGKIKSMVQVNGRQVLLRQFRQYLGRILFLVSDLFHSESHNCELSRLL